MVSGHTVTERLVRPVSVFSLETGEKIGRRHAVPGDVYRIALYHGSEVPLVAGRDGRFYPRCLEEERFLYH